VKRLLDTNAYVALMRGHGDVAAHVRDAEALVFSLFVVGELLFGFRNGTRARANSEELERFLGQPDVQLALPTWGTAERFGLLATALRKAGTPIPTNDVWIAAHALETGAEVLTFARHFAVAGVPAVILS
jgi:tRNA(fMet)-specific endonuclease VapC